jgi:uncharacterized membrane protein YoaK (UPF0700 family)
MFRHKGKSRTLEHNLKIATLLSFVAGVVNIVGFLAVQKLTTNVTGHFAFFGDNFILAAPNVLAYLLLFAMGLQNSLVTSISNATVRTTHITGLFTDLGIELSQLFFYKLKEQRERLISSIKLRFTIISFKSAPSNYYSQ